MTTEEKLSKAVEFIKSIDNMILPTITTSNIIESADVYCEECGEECDIDIIGPNTKYVEADVLEDLKDRAWHLLIDLVD